ncbi:MAG: hypothetical protein L0H64_17610 [Pseudonocardia sp.]|nr:hypothetical protein [Pseudonocardia sp.]
MQDSPDRVDDAHQYDAVVDEGPPLLPPPPSWVERVRALGAEHDLAPVFGGEPEHALTFEGRLDLHPWRARRDVGALLEWTRHLEGPVSVTRAPGPVRRVDTVWVHGVLGGHPTRLVAHTHRLPSESLVTLSVELLERFARDEVAADRLDDERGDDVDARSPVPAGAR